MANAKLLGKVDLLGLNSMGQPVGKTPLWGILIGGGVSQITTMGLMHSSSRAARHADLLGFLAGAATGGALIAAGKSTRGMGAAAIATAFITAGFPWLKRILFGAPRMAAAQAATGTQGVGLPALHALNGGLGMPALHALNGGMGLPSMTASTPPQGTIPGVAGIQVSGAGMSMPPVNLLGQQAQVNGPSISGLSARYGATLLGTR